MNKTNVIAIATLIIAIMTIANVVMPTYAMLVPQSIESCSEYTINEVKVHAKRTDIFQLNQHLIKIEAEAEVAGQIITIKSTPYPLDKILESGTPKESRYRFQGLMSICKIQDSLPKYTWDGIVFVKSPGNYYTRVKYDHADNYDTYYPQQVNRDYTLKGNTKYIHHLSVSTIEDAKFKCTFSSIAGLLGPIIAGLLLIPEIVSKVVAGIIALFGGICSLLGYTAKWFIENFVQTELNDGWAYTWSYGRWVFFGWTLMSWFWMSFGSLRDWGFLVII